MPLQWAVVPPVQRSQGLSSCVGVVILRECFLCKTLLQVTAVDHCPTDQIFKSKVSICTSAPKLGGPWVRSSAVCCLLFFHHMHLCQFDRHCYDLYTVHAQKIELIDNNKSIHFPVVSLFMLATVRGRSLTSAGHLQEPESRQSMSVGVLCGCDASPPDRRWPVSMEAG